MERLTKNSEIELVVDGLGMHGEGVAHVGGKTVFVKDALPGERVRAKIIFDRPTFSNAIVAERLCDSPDRVPPACPLFGRCGGCQLQHLRYEAQLAAKLGAVADMFYKNAGMRVDVAPVYASPLALRYRNKMSLPVRQSPDGVTVGLFARASHRVVPVADCLLQREWNAPLIAALSDYLTAARLSGYDEQTGQGDVRHLVVREVGEAVDVAVVATHAIDLRPLAARLEELFPARFTLWRNINRRHDNVILGGDWRLVAGEDAPRMVDGYRMAVHPAGFFQVNDEVRAALFAAVIASLPARAARIVDAYSGAGLLTAGLARHAESVYGIEIVPEAHAAALRLKEDNGIDNMFPLLGDVVQRLPALLEGGATAIVLDPPRSGCERSVLDAVCAAGAQAVLYISCNPATLARDVALLSSVYEPISVRPFDMFPQTVSVETLVVLSKKSPTGLSASM